MERGIHSFSELEPSRTTSKGVLGRLFTALSKGQLIEIRHLEACHFEPLEGVRNPGDDSIQNSRIYEMGKLLAPYGHSGEHTRATIFDPI
jgi:hypothetical protein